MKQENQLYCLSCFVTPNHSKLLTTL